MFGEHLVKLNFCVFNAPTVFLDTDPCDVNMSIGIPITASFLNGFFEFGDRLFKLRHLKSSRIEDSDRYPIFTYFSCVLCHRATLSGFG